MRQASGDRTTVFRENTQRLGKLLFIIAGKVSEKEYLTNKEDILMVYF